MRDRKVTLLGMDQEAIVGACSGKKANLCALDLAAFYLSDLQVPMNTGI
jgi:hypothetical protein